MSGDKVVVIRKTFTLTPKDLEVIENAKRKCGVVSDSETLRMIIRFFEQHAQCLKS